MTIPQNILPRFAVTYKLPSGEEREAIISAESSEHALQRARGTIAHLTWRWEPIKAIDTGEKTQYTPKISYPGRKKKCKPQ